MHGTLYVLSNDVTIVSLGRQMQMVMFFWQEIKKTRYSFVWDCLYMAYMAISQTIKPITVCTSNFDTPFLTCVEGTASQKFDIIREMFMPQNVR